MLFDVMKKGFDDELEKISGSLQGHVRSGRRPMKASTLLRKESEGEGKKLAEIVKLSGSHGPATTLGLIGLGMFGLHQLNKAKRRYNIGRQAELQQQGY